MTAVAVTATRDVIADPTEDVEAPAPDQTPAAAATADADSPDLALTLAISAETTAALTPAIREEALLLTERASAQRNRLAVLTGIIEERELYSLDD
jgi:hypothetical protein